MGEVAKTMAAADPSEVVAPSLIPPSTTLYVGDLDPSVTKTDLLIAFASIGPIASIRLYHDHLPYNSFVGTIAYRSSASKLRRQAHRSPPRHPLLHQTRHPAPPSDLSSSPPLWSMPPVADVLFGSSISSLSSPLSDHPAPLAVGHPGRAAA